MAAFLDQYVALDVIGNGSFGIIRKVRRKSDGLIFARKELNFERMSERDRKQIVAEVNILKDLHHDHIVRYHDRYVDRDAGILYILMEYCGGGDLSTVIKQSIKHNRTIPEDTIWSYFLQLLLALQYCHHPNGGHGRASSGVGVPEDNGKERRPQILHRDLKPDNIFLDEANTVKLGDFGLSKALAQASFANTYVGTPYYMSPELMQEKAYDSKSDIWSLGCLIYELCALKPPFHEARTHTELSASIQTGRIPPLPRSYSQALTSVIKNMLNLNPAMRPSAAQLLQHERLELTFKVSETEKMLATVKSHKAALQSKERDLHAREATYESTMREFHAILAAKDAQIAHLASTQAHAVQAAVAHREEELRVLVMAREAEVAGAMQRREEEIMGAIRAREEELGEAWRRREVEVEERVRWVGEREAWVGRREGEIKEEEERLAVLRREAEERVEALERGEKGRKEKTPLEEVKNLLARMTEGSPPRTSHAATVLPKSHAPLQPIPFPNNITNDNLQATPTAAARSHHRAALENYIPSSSLPPPATPASAMKGVVFTMTGEPLATPTPGELATLFVNSPRVGLNFGRIFDSSSSRSRSKLRNGDNEDGEAEEEEEEEEEEVTPPPSPSKKIRTSTSPSKRDVLRSPSKSSSSRQGVQQKQRSGSAGSSSSGSTTTTTAKIPVVGLPSRIRRPSIVRASSTTRRPVMGKTVSMPLSSVEFTAPQPPVASSSSSTTTQQQHRRSGVVQPMRHPHLLTGTTKAAMSRANTMPLPNANFDDDNGDDHNNNDNECRGDDDENKDEDDVPSPFLKRGVGVGISSGGGPNGASGGGKVSSSSSNGAATATIRKRPSSGNMLRAVAAANSAGIGRKGGSGMGTTISPGTMRGTGARV